MRQGDSRKFTPRWKSRDEKMPRQSGPSAFLWVIHQDHRHRYGVLARFHYHRARHGAGSRDHDRGVIIACIIMLRGPPDRGRRRFVAEHPTTKMMALAFLVLIGVRWWRKIQHFISARLYLFCHPRFGCCRACNVRAGANREKAAGCVVRKDPVHGARRAQATTVRCR